MPTVSERNEITKVLPPSIHQRLMTNNPKYRERHLRREKARKEGNTLPKGTL